MTGIEWTDRTWNPVTGCTKVSPGCKYCYMHRLYPRLRGSGRWATTCRPTWCRWSRSGWQTG